MADLAQIIPIGGLSAVFGFGSSFALQWFKSRGETSAAQVAADVQIQLHRDKLTLELVTAVRAELTAAQAEVRVAREDAAHARTESAILRQSEARLAHLEEALDHIEALINSDGVEECKAAERRATAFLKRMRRMADAIGTLRNEAQINVSASALPDEMRAALDTLDGKDTGK